MKSDMAAPLDDAPSDVRDIASASGDGSAPILSINTEYGSVYTQAEVETARRDGRIIITDYPYRPKERRYESTVGGERIMSLLNQNNENYDAALDSITRFSTDYAEIAVDGNLSGAEPVWINGWLPALDSMYLYSLIRMSNPRLYFEIGSGHSTKFVRRAIKDGKLSTKIVSVDPFPRAEIDELCDIVIRQPFESIAESMYRHMIKPGDIVFIDNSHRSFQSSDVTVFFTEMLPTLPRGVLFGIHDIFIPFDYPQVWVKRFYNEQYLLLSYIHGGGAGDEIIFPGAYISRNSRFQDRRTKLFETPHLAKVEQHAGAFWMRRG